MSLKCKPTPVELHQWLIVSQPDSHILTVGLPVPQNRLQQRRLDWRCIPRSAWWSWHLHPTDSVSGLHEALPGTHRAKLETETIADWDINVRKYSCYYEKHHNLLYFVISIRFYSYKRHLSRTLMCTLTFLTFLSYKTWDTQLSGMGEMKRKAEGDH